MKPGDICRVVQTPDFAPVHRLSGDHQAALVYPRRVIGGGTAFTYGSIVEIVAADTNNALARCRLIMGGYHSHFAERWHNKYGSIPLNYSMLACIEKQP